MATDRLLSFVTETARRQGGLIRRDQIEPADQRRFRRLAERGVIEAAGRGVFRISGSPVTWLQRLTAGAWSLGPGTVVSHLAAAQLHRLEGFTDDALAYTVGRGQRGRRVNGAQVHSLQASIPRRDRVTVEGLAVTSPARTIVDLARDGVAAKRLERAVDSALSLRLTTLDQLVARVDEVDGGLRRGVDRLVPVLLTSGGHSFLERRFLELVRRAGYPKPVTQVVHRLDGRHVGRVDFEFPQHNVIVEVSGGRGHSSAADRARDATRRNKLQHMGFIVLEFTYEMLINKPEDVIATLRASIPSDEAQPTGSGNVRVGGISGYPDWP